MSRMKKGMSKFFLLQQVLLFLFVNYTSARVYIVDGKADIHVPATGSLEEPFLKIQRCVDELKINGTPGS